MMSLYSPYKRMLLSGRSVEQWGAGAKVGPAMVGLPPQAQGPGLRLSGLGFRVFCFGGLHNWNRLPFKGVYKD